MLYKTARTYAEDILSQLHPLCPSIAIAGSVRRHCGLCGDLDIVCLCSDIQRERVRERCLRGNPKIVSNGEQILSIVINNGVRLQVNFAKPTTKDLFEPTPSNWGSILLMRTGSKDFNKAICLRAASLGCQWKPFKGIVRDGKIVASETEEEIFKALKLKYIQPPARKQAAQKIMEKLTI